MPNYFVGVDVPAYIIAAVVGMVLCFWGLQLSRFIASIAFASVLGYLTYVYTFKAFASIALSIIFMLLAIAVGFVLGFTLFRASLSIVFGYVIASILVRDVAKTKELVLLIILTIIFSILIYVLSNYVLALLFVATGSALVYKSLVILGLQSTIAFLIVVVIAVAGLYNQLKRRV
ncbi:MAG: hypothetical protein QW632_02135 [Ignisphaera sp.]